MRRVKRQEGFTLLEVLMVVAIMSVLAVLDMQDRTLRIEQEKARQLGMELYKYNSAVREYVSVHGGSNNASSFLGTKTGVNWLKSSSCGGTADKDYLPCNYLSSTGGQTTYGRMTFTTTITAPVVGEKMTGVTIMSQLTLAGKQRDDLAGLAALVARGASSNSDTPLLHTTDGAGVYCATANSDKLYNLCTSNIGRIVLRASTDVSQDSWLRTDGSNKMLNAITFETGDSASDTSFGNREIRNVTRIFNGFTGTRAGDDGSLTIGNAGLTQATGFDVIVDADQEVLGALEVRSYVRGDKFIDDDNVNYYLDPNGNSVLNNVNINNLVVNNDVKARRFVDKDNEAYFVDPAGQSRINGVTLSAITGEENGNQLSMLAQRYNFKASNGAVSASNPVSLNAFANVDGFNVKTRSGNFVPLSSMLPDYVQMEVFAAAANQTVSKPTCSAGGIPKIIITPMNMESHDKYHFRFSAGGGNSPYTYDISDYTSGRSFMYAQDSGGTWTIKAGTGSGVDDPSSFGLATTYCAY